MPVMCATMLLPLVLQAGVGPGPDGPAVSLREGFFVVAGCLDRAGLRDPGPRRLAARSQAADGPAVVCGAGELRACVQPHGSPSSRLPARTFVGETRAGLVHVLLLALVLRDALVGFAAAEQQEEEDRRRLWSVYR